MLSEESIKSNEEYTRESSRKNIDYIEGLIKNDYKEEGRAQKDVKKFTGIKNLTENIENIQKNSRLQEEHRQALEERQKFIELIGSEVSWIKVHDGQKRPNAKKVKYIDTIPDTENIGAHPLGHVVAFDFDVKGEDGVPVDEQLRWLTEEFGFNFTGAIKVLTPSGGRHVYIRWSNEVALPKNWKLSELFLDPEKARADPDNAEKVPLCGDLRSSLSSGHCVIPGSFFAGRFYRLYEEGEIVLQSQETCQKFIELHKSYGLDPEDLDGSEKPINKENKKQRPKRAADNIVIDEDTLARLRTMLQRRGSALWHVKRARVSAALSCCAEPEVINAYWSALGLGQDTTLNNYLPSYAVYSDALRLAPRVKHGAYCQKGLSERKKHFTERTSEEWGDFIMRKLKKSTSWKQPIVLNMKTANAKLMPGRQKPGKYYPLAIAIVEDFLQPWANFGVSRIMLGNSFLAEFYDVSEVDIGSAKKLLIRKEIIATVQRQGPGRTTAFKVCEELIDVKLTKLLIALKHNYKTEVTVDSRSGDFTVPFSGKEILTLDKKPLTNFLSAVELPEKLVNKNLHDLLIANEKKSHIKDKETPPSDNDENTHDMDDGKEQFIGIEIKTSETTLKLYENIELIKEFDFDNPIKSISKQQKGVLRNSHESSSEDQFKISPTALRGMKLNGRD